MAGQDGTGVHRREIHAERKGGLRRASVRDFHGFRLTRVTLALSVGVSLELVQNVTGHKTTDIVLKHYFRFRAVFSGMATVREGRIASGNRPA